ncbi:unnamed protein product [Polarella glacialis]|uniref:Pentatricopeptide repeat-containing protein, chloroplastic n=1 Tax=Polarella glacialis TaxID=89957 RepID=A0A813FI39_POLGL|nr:unnamed protein product [Polarella glacialis]
MRRNAIHHPARHGLADDGPCRHARSVWLAGFEKLQELRQSSLVPDAVDICKSVAAITSSDGKGWASAWALLHILRDQRLETNAACFNSLLRSRGPGSGDELTCWQWQWGLAVLQTMSDQGLPADAITCSVMLGGSNGPRLWSHALAVLEFAAVAAPASSSRCFEKGRRRHLQNWRPTDIAAVNAAVAAIGRAQHWRHALGFLELIRGADRTRGCLASLRVQPDLITYSSLIAAIASSEREAGRGVKGIKESGFWPVALALLLELLDAGHRPNVATLNAAASAFVHGRAWTVALDLLGSMEFSGVGWDTQSSNAALSAFSQGKQWERAMTVLLMAGKQRLAPNTVTLNAAADAVISSGLWEQARFILQTQMFRGLVPDAVTWRARASLARTWEEGLWELREAQDSGFVKDVFIYNSVIYTMAGASLFPQRGSSWQVAHWLLIQMAQAAAEPDVISINTVLEACSNQGSWKQALAVLQMAATEGIVADTVSHNTVLSAFGASTLWMRAFQVLACMPHSAVQTDKVSCSTTISACLAAQQWARSLELVHEMLVQRTEVQATTRSELLRECEQRGLFSQEIKLSSMRP